MYLQAPKERLVSASFFVALGGLALLYWLQATKWWIADDPAILKFTAQHSLYQCFFVPKIWRRFSPSNLTPMVLLSFKLDLGAFGLRPALFYLHQVAAVVLATFLLFTLLKRYIDPLLAALASLSFMLSAATTQCASLLMSRHYVEGLLFCLLSLLFYSRYLQEGERWSLALSLFCYALASLCKEVFVPLPLVLALWPPDPNDTSANTLGAWVKSRLRTALPFFGLVILYTLYRRWMLGRFMGGYGSLGAVSPGGLLHHAYEVAFSGNPWLFLPCLCLLLVLALRLAIERKGRALLFVAAAALCTISPLLPISNGVSERHLLLPTLALMAAVAFGADRISRMNRRWAKPAAVLAMGLLIFTSAWAHQGAQKRFKPIAQSFAETGRFLWFKSTANDAVVNPLIPNWHFYGLKWLKEKLEHQGTMGQCISNLCYAAVLGGYNTGHRLWKYDPSREKVVKVPGKEAKHLVNECRSNFKKKAMYARIWEAENAVHWSFGPYKNGRYFMVDRITGYPYPLPQKGTYPATLDALSLQPEKLAICYQDRSGWKTCTTPEIKDNTR